MRKVLISMADSSPEYRAMLRATAPSHARYAVANNYAYYCASPEEVSDLSRGRGASWAKVAILERFVADGVFALFLDADVRVMDCSRDVVDDFPCGKKFGMVVHQTSDGAVPNCGVLACMGDCRDELASLWDRGPFTRSSCWWEQASMIHLLGADPDATSISVPEGPLWGELPYVWNPHVNDGRRIPQDARFFHATMIADRAKVLASLATLCGDE